MMSRLVLIGLGLASANTLLPHPLENQVMSFLELAEQGVIRMIHSADYHRYDESRIRVSRREVAPRTAEPSLEALEYAGDPGEDEQEFVLYIYGEQSAAAVERSSKDSATSRLFQTKTEYGCALCACADDDCR